MVSTSSGQHSQWRAPVPPAGWEDHLHAQVFVVQWVVPSVNTDLVLRYHTDDIKPDEIELGRGQSKFESVHTFVGSIDPPSPTFRIYRSIFPDLPDLNIAVPADLQPISLSVSVRVRLHIPKLSISR